MMLFLIAKKDLFFEKLLSFCVVTALCAVIAPLLILFSLRFGVIDSLEANLKKDPTITEISLVTSSKFTKENIDEIENRFDVGFLIPKTRSLSLTVMLKANDKILDNVETWPSKKGDPILIYSNLDMDLANDELFLSETISYKLNLKKDDTLYLYVKRQKDSKSETSKVLFKVKGILQKGSVNRDTILVNLDNTIYMEDYRDGFEPPIFSDGSLLNKNRTFFPKLRIYAKDIDNVESLSKYLQSKNINVFDHMGQIQNVKAISHVLNFIFLGIALPCIIGGSIAFSGLIISLINKKIKSYALLRLSGLNLKNLYIIVLLETFLLAIIAFTISLIIYYIVSFSFNAYFSPFVDNFAAISKLSLLHISFALLLTLFIALCVSLASSYFFLKVPLSKALRMV